jgi:hypothetical protein
MNPMMLVARLSMVALGMAVVAAHAGNPVPQIGPQWIASFSSEFLLDDTIAQSRAPTSLAMSNGDFVVATSSANSLVLRRLAADGSVLFMHEEPGYVSIMTMRADAATGALYVWAGDGSQNTRLLRFDAQLRREWSFDASSGYYYDSDLQLEVLSDGSAVMMLDEHLMSVGTDGHLRWSIENFDDGRAVTASALARAHDDTLWAVASSSSNPLNGDIAVMRYGPDGTRLSLDHVACSSCYPGSSVDIDVLPDGTATVVGETGSSPATFFARFAADGQRLLWIVPVDAAISYMRAFHDSAGSIFVMSGNGNATLRRVEPTTGGIIWTRSATDFIPLDDGGLIVYESSDPFPQGIQIVSYDRDARVRWSRMLPGSDATHISHGDLSNGIVSLLVQNQTPSPAPCGINPRLNVLDAKGSLFEMPLPCRTDVGTVLPRAFDASSEHGLLVNLRYALESIDPAGNVRWLAKSCDWCTSFGSGESLWGGSALAADGGTWAMERVQYAPGLPEGETRIKHLDSNGIEDRSVLAAAQDCTITQARVLASAGDAITLQPTFNGGGVTWQRVRADGTTPASRNYSIPDTQSYRITDARLLEDGGVMFVVKGDYVCSVGCSPHYITVLRLDAQGALRWRYQFPESEALIALTDNGSASAVLQTYPVGLVLRRLDTQGHATDTPLVAVTPARPYAFAGPIHGHWLLGTNDSFDRSLWLIDADGSVIASRTMGNGEPRIRAASEAGYLVSGFETLAPELIDVDTMETRVIFDLTGVGGLYYDDPLSWSLLEDGLVYMSVPTYTEPNYRIGIARFALPGSAGADLLFRNGYD